MAIRTTDYVKFIRGNQAAFDLLAQKDANTLYFISEKESTTGALYLGSKLISGGATGVSELGNIVIENIGDSQILYYDYESEAWVNGSIYDLISAMKGATADADSTIGLVPVAKAGQQNLFLRGDGTWATPEFEPVSVNFDANIFANNDAEEVSFVGFKDAVVGSLLTKSEAGNIEWTTQENLFTSVNGEIDSLKEQISKIEGGVTRTIVGSLDEINKENENIIYMVPKEDGEGHNFYNEFMVINGNLEQIGAGFSGDITGFVKESDFNIAIGTLENSISGLDTKVSNMETTVSNLSSNFVSVEKYNAEVGDLTSVVNNWEKQTIVEQVDLLTSKTTELTDMLTWYEL